MTAPLAALLMLVSASFADGPETGLRLDYEGSLVARKGNPIATTKKFHFTLLVADSRENDLEFLWTVRENGRGGWSWLDRFGHAGVGPTFSREDEVVFPSLLYERTDGDSTVVLTLPFLDVEKSLSEGSRWRDGGYTYEVVGSRRIADRDAWKIEVRNNYGRKRTLWREKESTLVLKLEEIVFLGQGEEHELTYTLKSAQQTGAESLTSEINDFDTVSQLRDQLGFAPRTSSVQWSPEKLAYLQKELSSIEGLQGQILEDVVRAARTDAQQIADRIGALDAIQSKVVGQQAPRPKLHELDGSDFDWKETDKRIVVLHFWTYQDKPLVEPYGQIAYLDYLLRNGGDKDLKVVGICVGDKNLADREARAAAARGAKKLKRFMNLSFPIVVDGGEAIREFGDPRPAGGELPLFVVIDRQGKVVHYHSGLYEVNRNRGLEELQQVVETSE